MKKRNCKKAQRETRLRTARKLLATHGYGCVKGKTLASLGAALQDLRTLRCALGAAKLLIDAGQAETALRMLQKIVPN